MGTKGLYVTVEHFIDIVNFEWHRQSEVGNGTLVLLRVCETLIFLFI